jgi:hypothetical protein
MVFGSFRKGVQIMRENRNWKLLQSALLSLTVALLIAGALPAQAKGDQFTATLVSMSGGGTSPVVIHIDHYTSDQERDKLQSILAAKGPDALRDALWDLESGYIRVSGGLGYPIAVARSHPEANGGRVVRIMIDRPLSFRELANGARSADYPFSYIEMHLDKSGKGEGTMIPAARVTLTGGTVDIEAFGPVPWRLLNIRTH